MIYHKCVDILVFMSNILLWLLAGFDALVLTASGAFSVQRNHGAFSYLAAVNGLSC